MKPPELHDIERMRKKFGLTQEELAKKAGISQSLVARVESGAVDPRYSKIARIFEALDEMKSKGIRARELMTGKVVGIQARDSMEKAASVMKGYDVSQLPVLKGKKQIGSISERIILDEIAKGIDVHVLSERKVSEFMEEPFPVVSLNAPLTSLSVLLENRPAVLIVDRGEIRGIVSRADLLKVIR